MPVIEMEVSHSSNRFHKLASLFFLQFLSLHFKDGVNLKTLLHQGLIEFKTKIDGMNFTGHFEKERSSLRSVQSCRL